jgi:hypothetical protein
MLILKFKCLSVTNTKKPLIPINYIKQEHLFNKYPQKSAQTILYITCPETILRAFVLAILVCSQSCSFWPCDANNY